MQRTGHPAGSSATHLAYVDALGAMRSEEAAWAPTMAGFVVLRLVDRWADGVLGWRVPQPNEIAAVRSAVDAVPAGEVRNALGGLVDAVTQSWGQRIASVAVHLLAYATLLYSDESWTLAGDVYRTLLSFASTDAERELVPHAWVRLGTCLAMSGAPDEAASAHEAAVVLAAHEGDRYTELLAQHGLAVVLLHRGNLPAADEAFGSVAALAEAERVAVPALADVLARALHDRGWVAIRRGETARAFGLLHEAMERTVEPRRRDRILNDLATAFLQQGDRATAQTALWVLERRTTDPTVRMTAALNLMHIATLDAAETVFERYVRALAGQPMPPRLEVHYQILVGEGCQRFGRLLRAERAFARAIVVAERHSLNELLIEAESAAKAAAADGAASATRVMPPRSPAVDEPEAVRVRRAIDELAAGLVGVGG